LRKNVFFSADASFIGLGAVLKQLKQDGEIAPVMFASRASTPPEQRYATFEKEALVMTYAAEKIGDFLL
jgi:hypothetical protein